MRFSEQFIQQVAQATDILDLVGQYLALKKKGREYKGLCPFHDDHNPSMSVVPDKQLFKCFSCGVGGGVFQFIMLYEKLTFPEAVRMLAERAHIPLPRDPHVAPAPEGYGKAELAEVTAFATQYYRVLLRGPQGAAALEYAHKRGFTDESIERFSLGYAPSGWDGLLKAARTKGFRESQLVAAGLVIRRESGDGCYDRFRNRLMFPILEPGGKVIAFGGRALDPEDRAKYLNSAESVLFDKSANLFALNWSREGIVSTGQAVVAEGYLDALIPLQAGVSNVVATLGTSLTERHVRLLSRYAREVVLVFDADVAGAAAADRGLELFLAQRINVRVATIPAGKDPCDYVLASGADAFRRLLAEAPDAIQYAWLRRQAKWQAAGGNLADRQAVVDDFLRLVVLSTAYDAIDEVRRGQLAQHIAHLLNLPATDLQLQMRRLARQSRQPAQPAGRTDTGVWHVDQRTGLAERQLLEVLVNRPDLFDLAAERVDPADFQDAELRAVAEAVWALGQAGRLCMEELLAAEATSSRGALLTDLAQEGQRRGNYDQVLRDMVSHLLYWREKHQMPAAPAAGQYSADDLRQVSQRLRTDDARRYPKIT